MSKQSGAFSWDDVRSRAQRVLLRSGAAKWFLGWGDSSHFVDFWGGLNRLFREFLLGKNDLLGEFFKSWGGWSPPPASAAYDCGRISSIVNDPIRVNMVAVTAHGSILQCNIRSSTDTRIWLLIIVVYDAEKYNRNTEPCVSSDIQSDAFRLLNV